MVSQQKLNLFQLDNRINPSVAFAHDGIVETIDSDSRTHFQPFQDYTGPLNVAHVARTMVAVSSQVSSRVQIRLLENNYVVFDQFTIEQNVPVDVALYDCDGDGDYDLLVGASQGGPRTQLYLNDNNNFRLIEDHFVFDLSFNGGVNVHGNGNSFAVFPNIGGGPVGYIDNKFYVFGNVDNRSTSDWVYGDVNLDGTNEVTLLVNNQLATFTINSGIVSQIYAATTCVSYRNIGLGSDASLDHQGILATFDDGFDEVDPLFGNLYFYEVGGDNYVMGDSYDPEPGVHKDFFDPTKETVSEFVNGGDSIGSTDTGTGTLTLKVIDNTDNTEVGLTNRHVAGQTVIQPGPADHPINTLGDLKRQAPLDGHVDSAIFTLNDPVLLTNKISLQFYNRYSNQKYYLDPITISGLDELKTGDVVYKTGRTTGTTRGVVYNDDLSTNVQYHDNSIVHYDHQNGIYSYSNIYASPGDSGSPNFIFKDNKFYLVGQLFAGGSVTTIVTDIKDVFNTLNLRLIE